MKQKISITIIVTFIICVLSVRESSPGNDIIESTAVDYMTALNKGDFERVVSLMHPEIIKNTKRAFIQKYEDAIAGGHGDKFRSALEINKNVNDLKTMKDTDLAVYLLRQIRNIQTKKNPTAVQRMQFVVVKAVSKEKIDHKTYKVRFKMVLPEDNKSIIPDGEYIIKDVNGVWKVYSN